MTDRRMDRTMLVECRRCPVQGTDCAGCMVTALLDPAAAGIEPEELATELPLDRAERQVVGRLVAAGLVSVETANAARARHEPYTQWQEIAGTG